MPWQWTQFEIPFLLSTAISGALAAYGLYLLREERSALVAGFVLTMVGSTVWSGLELLEMAAYTLETKLLFLHLNVGKDLTVLGFLAFALAYTNNDRWLRPRWLAVAALWPAVYYLLIRPGWQYLDALSPGQDVYMGGPGPAIFPDSGFRRLAFDPGLAGAVDALWAYGVVLVGMVVVARFAYRKRGVYRFQAGLILVGALVPTALNVPLMIDGWDLFGYQWTLPLNPSPVAMSVTGIALAVAISRYRFLDLVPVARDTVIETMRDGYVVVDEDDRVVDLNPAARELLDVDDGAVGTAIGDLIPGDDVIDRHGTGYRLQGEIEVGEGDDARYVEVDVSELTEDDRFIGRLVTLRDVTERRSVEKRYQALIEHSSDLITVLDRDGTVRYQSPSVRRILGHDPRDMRGESVFDYVHPDDRKRTRENFLDVLTGDTYEGRVEFRVRTATGDYRVVEAVGQNLLDNPFVEGVVVNSRDVTERKERERELRRKNERLDEFASVVSHDLRNPLSVAQGRVELAIERDADDHLPIVRDSLSRMEAIIDDVLTLARQGAEVGETDTVDLEERAREAWSNVDTASADVVVENTRQLSADPDRLLQLFENLFRNAVEHGSTSSQPSADDAVEHAGEDVTVTVGATPEGFFVEDDGPGIPADERDDVFESGYTTATDGTGFGLAIVDRIAEAHDWSVAATRGSAGGARFEVEGLDAVVRAEATDDD